MTRLNKRLLPGIGSTLILMILFLHFLLLGMTQLVVPLYALSLGASEVVLGVITGAFGVAGILLSILSSVLSDYLGRRPMILVSFQQQFERIHISVNNLTNDFDISGCVRINWHFQENFTFRITRSINT